MSLSGTGWISVFATSLQLSIELVESVLGLDDVRNEFAHFKWRAPRIQDPLELRDSACARWALRVGRR